MGIIRRQSIKGTIYSYLGVLVGFVTTGLLFPNFLSTDQIGLLNLLVSWASVFAVVGSLGFNHTILRLFPYFRDKEGRHHGFFLISALVAGAGFMIITFVYFLLRSWIIADSIEQSPLFVEYMYLIPPLILVIILFNVFDSYNRSLYNASFGTFLKELLQRLLILTFTILFIIHVIDFRYFTYGYVVALSTPGILILLLLITRKQTSLKFDPGHIDGFLRKNLIQISVFGILVSAGQIITQKISTIMVNSFLDLNATGVFAISAFFGTLISMPSRSVSRISSGTIAEAWKNDNRQEIQTVYYKSCLIQGIFGILVFIGIWANIHNVYRILPQEYQAGKYVILLFALSNLITMLAGTSGIIISLSKYYKNQALFTLFSGITLIILSYLLIPAYGINGAAAAVLLANLLFQSSRILFVRIRFKFQPFDYRTLLVLLLGALTYTLNLLIPTMEALILDILLRSLFLTFVFLIPVLLLKLSDDLNDKFLDSWTAIRSLFKKT